jgi:uncharacterized protein YfdQ (DUF2303 family)
MEKSGIQEIQRLASVSKCNEALIAALGDEGRATALVPDGYHLENLQQFLQAPHRNKFDLTAGDIEAFTALINRFRTPETIIFSNGKAGYRAVFNYSTGEKPGWGDQMVRFGPGFHDDYKLVKSWFNKWFDQFGLADIVHDNMDLFSKPAGADLRDLILDLRGEQTEAFASAKVLKDGTISCSRHQDVKLMSDKAPDSVIEIPDLIHFGVPVFEGGEKIEISVEVRFRVRDGEVKFKLHRPDRFTRKLEEEEAILLDKAVAKVTECQVLYLNS